MFGITSLPPISENYKYFLAGFVAGEGSFNVSANKNKSSRLGLVIDPEFSCTQHVNGVHYLLAIREVLGTGTLRHKAKSLATMVLTVDNRESITKYVLPFVRKYGDFNYCPYLLEQQERFAQIIKLLDGGAHKDEDRLINDVLPVWDKLRKQKGQSNQSFSDLEATQKYVREFSNKKKKR